MIRRHVLVLLAAAALGCTPNALRAQSPAVDETQHSAEALLAVTNHWSDAEVQGDTAYLSRLLAPEYRSVNADGSFVPRSTLIDHAAHRTPEQAAAITAWRASHHHGTRVVIDHDTAVLSYYSGPDSPDAPISSSDIFVYRDHHWQALYSGHTALKVAAQ